jgi:hypothetical protein
MKTNNGNFFEKMIMQELNTHNIPYKTQVPLYEYGNMKCKIDIVIGDDVSCISECIVLSCKISCRERWTQDNWTKNIQPKKYLLLTLNNDYPLSKRFEENCFRKIITIKERKKDDRIFKLNFEDLISEIKNTI